jgi:hypothetical protein
VEIITARTSHNMTVNNEKYLEKRFSNLIAPQVDVEERDRRWQTSSSPSDVLLDCSSHSKNKKSQDIPPIRPGAVVSQQHNNKEKSTRVFSPVSIQHKERGLHRPDDWVGELKQKNRKSWKAKVVTTDVVNLDDDDDDDSDDDQHHSVQSCVFPPVSIQHKERGLHRPDDWVGELKQKNRKSWKAKAVMIDVVVNLDDDDSDDQHHSVQSSVPVVDFGRREEAPLLFSNKPKHLLDSSRHLILTEQGSSRRSTRVSEAKEMWKSMTALDEKAIADSSKLASPSKKQPRPSVAVAVTKKRDDWIQGSKEMNNDDSTSSSLLGGTADMLAAASNRKPAKSDTASDKKDLLPPVAANQPPTTNTNTNHDSLPCLDMSLSSLGDTMSLSSIHEQQNHESSNMKMMGKSQSTGNIRKPSLASDISAKHRFRAYDRPDTWLGPSSKPARKSWTAKKIVESV